MSPSDAFYPSAEAIRHGAWLKHLTAQLPELAARYGLTAFRLRRLQQLTHRYLAWLRDQATEAQQPATHGAVLLARVRPLVEELRAHPAFGPADARLLRVAEAPWSTLPMPAAGPAPRRPPEQTPAPLPTPRLAALLQLGSHVLVMWRRRCGAYIELQVSRNGGAWAALVPPRGRQRRLFDPVLPAPTQRPLTWCYRGRYVGGDGHPGPWSEPLRVLLTLMVSAPLARLVLASAT